MAVRVAEIDASAAVPGVQLAIIQMPGVTPVGDAGFLHPPQNGIELLVAHMKGVMMTFKGAGVVKIEGQGFIDPYRREVARGPIIGEAEEVREKARRGVLVPCWDDGVIQSDGHRYTSSVGFIGSGPCRVRRSLVEATKPQGVAQGGSRTRFTRARCGVSRRP